MVTGMADYDTLTELLIAQPERKLQKLRNGIVTEIERLGVELRLVDEALTRKRSRGRSDEALAHIKEIGHPVKPPEVREVLVTKGIVRKVEAVRTAMTRLVSDGLLERTHDGRFAVPNGNGARVEAGHPLFRETDLESQD